MSRIDRDANGETWAIVLAAGEGTRLRDLTTDANGRSTPKQFWSLGGGRSLLGLALARAGRVVPVHRTVVVVAAEHARWWQDELADLPPENVVVQPRNRGTAPGILLPLLTILDRDAGARVVAMASDHYVRDEATLAAGFRLALAGLVPQSQALTLIGITPDGPETDYGWIVPGGESAFGTQSVRRFVEKPPHDLARTLRASGGVWNSFLFAARAHALVELCRRRLPRTVEALLAARGPRDLGTVYEKIDASDFSRDVLQGAESELRLLIAPPCGWTDLGTPARVRECLAAIPAPAPSPVQQPRFDLRMRTAELTSQAW